MNVRHGLLAVGACIFMGVTLPASSQDPPGSRGYARQGNDASVRALLRGGDRTTARAAFLQLAQTDSTSAVPRYNLGVLAEADENWDEAVKWFLECARLAPPGSELKRRADAAILRARGNAQKDLTAEGKRRRQYDEAIARAKLMLEASLAKEAFSEAAIAEKIDPARWEAHVAAASALQLQRQFVEARDFLKVAFDRAPPETKAKISFAIERNLAEERKISKGGKLQ